VTKDNADQDHFLRKFVETHDPLNSENVNVTTRNRTHAAISHERPKKNARKTSVQKTTKIVNCANERQNEQRNERPKRTTKQTARRTTKTSFVKAHEQHAANKQSNYV
jgi:hypothetical protein